MATSTITRNLHFDGAWQGINSGFVAPSDGFVFLSCASSGGANWFYTSHGRISMTGGLTQEASFPIKKGETFTITAFNDGSRVSAAYMPLVVGGVIRKLLNTLQTLSFRTERGWA